MPFFANESTKSALNEYIEFLKSLTMDTSFEGQVRDDTLSLLNIMRNAPEEWDEFTPFNSNEIGEMFLDELKLKSDLKKKTHFVYALAIRFLNELYVTSNISFDNLYLEVKDNAYKAIEHINSIEAKWHLRFAFLGMPLEIIKKVLDHDDIKVFQDYTAARNSAEQLKNDWSVLLADKEKEVKRLEETLVKQKHSYQFIELNKGFQSLLEQKKSQLSFARVVLIFLGLILPASILFEMLFWVGEVQGVSYKDSLLRFLPALSLTLILIYYFRIALQNHQSIKAQILQIEFRMTLCGFIQSYAEYSVGIKTKNANSLSKFEDVIFSNIMTSEDKIPSTFDGVEQVSALITSIKGGRDSSKSS